MSDDTRLWVSSDVRNYPPHGYGWSVEAKDERGFTFERAGGTISYRAARRAVKRGEAAARKLWRTTAPGASHVE